MQATLDFAVIHLEEAEAKSRSYAKNDAAAIGKVAYLP